MSRKSGWNPFYTLLMIVSTLFVITTLGYLVGPFVARRAIDRQDVGVSPLSALLAGWFERKGVIALAIEFAAMAFLAIAAMATDRYFFPADARKPGPADRLEPGQPH